MNTTDCTLMTAEEFAALFRISKARAYELARRELIPGVVRLGRTVRFRRSSVLEFMQGGRVAPDARPRLVLPNLHAG